MAGITFFLNLRFNCCKCKNVYCLNHVTCNQSWIKLKFYFASFIAYILSSIMSFFATTKKKGGGSDAYDITVHIMNQVCNTCVIQCTIQIFHHYYKSEILNLEMTTF